MLTRTFSVPELKLLADAVESSKFITKKKSGELTEKLSRLAGKHQAEELKRNIDVEGRIKTENEQIYYIIDAINSAINIIAYRRATGIKLSEYSLANLMIGGKE